MKLSDQIRRARLAKGLEQQEVEERLGIPYTTLCHVERGRRRLSWERLQALAKLLGIPRKKILKTHLWN